jgi:hypothetical protein
MSQTPVTIHLPDALYDRVRQFAEDTNRPLETVLLESVSLLFDDSPESLTVDDLQTLSDAQLWAVVYRRLAWNQSLRLHELSTKYKSDELSTDEQAELDAHLDRNDHYMLLRSEALLILQQRGADIQSYLQSAS